VLAYSSIIECFHHATANSYLMKKLFHVRSPWQVFVQCNT